MANGEKTAPPTAAQAAGYGQSLIEHLDEPDDIKWATDREHVMSHVSSLVLHFVELARSLEVATGQPNSLVGTGIEELFE